MKRRNNRKSVVVNIVIKANVQTEKKDKETTKNLITFVTTVLNAVIAVLGIIKILKS